MGLFALSPTCLIESLRWCMGGLKFFSIFSGGQIFLSRDNKYFFPETTNTPRSTQQIFLCLVDSWQMFSFHNSQFTSLSFSGHIQVFRASRCEYSDLPIFKWNKQFQIPFNFLLQCSEFSFSEENNKSKIYFILDISDSRNTGPLGQNCA